MMKRLFTLGAIGACALTAAAQSSVTVFGVLDVAATSVRNGSAGSIQSLTGGGNLPPRFGIRGVEDLGGGWKADFWLEGSLQPDTGVAGGAGNPAGQFWDRRSTLGVTSDRFGGLRLGRDYTPTYLVWVVNDPLGYSALIAAANNLISTRNSAVLNAAFGANPNANPLVRVNNSVQYLLPRDLGGLYGGAMVSAGEGVTLANGGTKGYGGRLGYRVGGFDLAAASYTTRNTANRESFQDRIVGVSYGWDIFKAYAMWQRFSYRVNSQSDTLLALTVNVWGGTAKVSYHRADQKGATAAVNNADATQWALGYVYDLSKRTALYGTLARLSNGSTATFNMVGGPTAGFRAGERASGSQFGVRHSF